MIGYQKFTFGNSGRDTRDIKQLPRQWTYKFNMGWPPPLWKVWGGQSALGMDPWSPHDSLHLYGRLSVLLADHSDLLRKNVLYVKDFEQWFSISANVLTVTETL